jgi:proteic killer suppression protein
MIRSFRGKWAVAVFHGRLPRGFPQELLPAARRKLRYLDAASHLADLMTPPGNRLETLSGDRKNQHSIRINDQWRVCFRWHDDGAEEVEIVDYH